METLFEQCEHNQNEEPCEVCTPKNESDEQIDIFEYDYNKRIWF